MPLPTTCARRAPLSVPLLVLVLLFVAACSSTEPTTTNGPVPPPDANLGPMTEAMNPMNVMPDGAQPDWAPTIDPQMLAVIEQLLATEPPKGGFPAMTPFQVRNAVLPAEAATELLTKVGSPPSPPKTDIAHRVLPVGSDEGTLVRMYRPLDAPAGPLPVIVYYHGGGWVIADLDTYEPSARALAAKTGTVVVSVAYRQAPEHRFPTAHEDAFAAYRWVTENTAEIGGDPNRIATAGESAGGNLAVAVALMARERGVALPAHILSVYPIADGDVQSPSYDEYANAVPLSRPFMEWFFDTYTPDWRTTEEPLIGLIDADLSGLPPTTIVNAEIDPLEAEGGTLAERLEAAGVDVERQLYEGVTHEFFGMAAILEQAGAAQDFAADRLEASFMSGRAAGGTGPMGERAVVVSSGLRGPESAIHDAEADVYLVSNVNGDPGTADDNGFISRIAPDGSVLELKWIDGADATVSLHAPKGLALAGDVLYVADLDGVHLFDRTTGGQIDVWETPGAQFLNAVAVAADGAVYATDTGIRFTESGAQPEGTSKVYRWHPDGMMTTMLEGDDLGGLNGIDVSGENPVAVTFMGSEVVRVDEDGSREVIATMPEGQLDGLVHLADGSHLVTSWAGKAVYHLGTDGSVTPVVEGVTSPADIHVDAQRNRVLVPQLLENTLRIVPLPSDG